MASSLFGVTAMMSTPRWICSLRIGICDVGSAAGAGVTGRVFEAEAGRITVMQGWHQGPTTTKPTRWTPTEAGEATLKLLAQAQRPGPVYGAE